jgi:hypothetical protein
MNNIKKLFLKKKIDFIEKKENRIEFSLNKVTFVIGGGNIAIGLYFIAIITDNLVLCVCWGDAIKVTKTTINLLDNNNLIMAINLNNIKYE